MTKGILYGLTRVVDVDLSGYFDNIRHHKLLEKVSRRVQDNDILHLLKLILNANGRKGVPQGGVISPLLSNIYLNEVDEMMERAREVTQRKGYDNLGFIRSADDMVILVHGHPKEDWLLQKVQKRLEIGKRVRAVRKANWNKPLKEVIQAVNAVIRGWVNYFRIGNSNSTFCKVSNYTEKKVRRFVMKRKKRKGFGWKRWSREVIYQEWGLYNDYRIQCLHPKAAPFHFVSLTVG